MPTATRTPGTFIPAAISFRAARSIKAGASPAGLAFDDLDSDGRQDLAIANREANTVTVLLGKSGLSFTRADPLPGTGRAPVAAVVADLDGDRIPDIATANSGDGTITTLMNDGHGVFGHGPAGWFRGEPSAIAAYRSGLAVADRINARVMVFGSASRGALDLEHEIAAGAQPVAIAAGDVDNDGAQDIVTANAAGKSVTIVRGSPSGFASTITVGLPAAPGAISLADINEDRRLDFAVAMPAANRVMVFEQKAPGQFGAIFDTTVPGAPRGLVLADDVTMPVSGDNKADMLVISEASNTLSVFKGAWKSGTEDLTFSTPVRYIVGTGPIAMVAGQIDFDRSGFADCIIANSAGTVTALKGSEGASYSAALSFPGVDGEPSAIAAADVDNDGALDVLVADRRDNTLSLLRGNGRGSLRKPVEIASIGAPVAALTADFDADGRTDLAVTGADGAVAIFRSDGGEAFEAARRLRNSGRLTAVATGDVDGDGRPDLLAADSTTGTVHVFGDLASTDSPAYSLPGIGPVAALAAGDFDGDGLGDIAAAVPGLERVVIWRQRGGGLFSSPEAVVTGSQFTRLLAVDLDVDGRLDIVTASQVDRSIGVHTGGYPGFPTRLAFAVSGKPVALLAADLNYDQLPDLATITEGADELTVFAGNGTGDFPRVSTFPAGRQAVAMVEGFFTNDVRPDIAVLSKVTGEVAMFRNNSNVPIPTPLPTRTPPPKVPAGGGGGGSGCDTGGGSAGGARLAPVFVLGLWLALRAGRYGRRA